MMRRSRRYKGDFKLNRNDKRFLGVCAGIADFLEVPAWVVRFSLVISFLMGAWFLIPAYFICYFFMDNNSGKFKNRVSKSTVFKHFQNVDYKKTLYRNTRDGKFLGVCAGIADYLEINTTIVRIVTFGSLFVAGPIPWVAYFAAYFVLEKAPIGITRKSKEFVAEADFFEEQDETVHQKEKQEKKEKAQRAKFKKRDYSKRKEFQRCARKFSNLHKRLNRMEAFVTSKQFKLHQQFKDI